MVLAVSDPNDHFELIQHALNFAEEYQIPVIVLSDKVSAEQYQSIEPLQQNTVPIKRGLVTGKDLAKLENKDRYRLTESGLSKRWVPGSAEARSASYSPLLPVRRSRRYSPASPRATRSPSEESSLSA